MSRIEEAMEKAEQLRRKDTVVRRPPEQRQQAQPLPKPPPPDRQIEISNPLLLAAKDFNPPVAEEYRKLKSVIVHATKKTDRFHNTLMVTSSISGEGKSLTAINLAISLAQEHDHTVLLIDADLRSPFICKYLGITANKGLADCLTTGMPIGEGLIKTGIGDLTVLPAGHQVTNPVELFSSQKMKDLLDEIKHRYSDRYIIFDMPPVLPFAETRLLGAIVDGVVFVVKEGATSLHNITEALASLKEANVLGIVYNEATTTSLYDGYYNYYAKYYSKSQQNVQTERGGKQKTGFFSRKRNAKNVEQ